MLAKGRTAGIGVAGDAADTAQQSISGGAPSLTAARDTPGRRAVGHGVLVEWADMGRHRGVITQFNEHGRRHKVEYADGDTCWHDLSTVRHEMLARERPIEDTLFATVSSAVERLIGTRPRSAPVKQRAQGRGSNGADTNTKFDGAGTGPRRNLLQRVGQAFVFAAGAVPPRSPRGLQTDHHHHQHQHQHHQQRRRRHQAASEGTGANQEEEQEENAIEDNKREDEEQQQQQQQQQQYGTRVVDHPISVLWGAPDSDNWHDGVVSKFDLQSGAHLVEYADGDSAWHDLPQVQHRLVDPRSPEGLTIFAGVVEALLSSQIRDEHSISDLGPRFGDDGSSSYAVGSATADEAADTAGGQAAPAGSAGTTRPASAPTTRLSEMDAARVALRGRLEGYIAWDLARRSQDSTEMAEIEARATHGEPPVAGDRIEIRFGDGKWYPGTVRFVRRMAQVGAPARDSRTTKPGSRAAGGRVGATGSATGDEGGDLRPFVVEFDDETTDSFDLAKTHWRAAEGAAAAKPVPPERTAGETRWRSEGNEGI